MCLLKSYSFEKENDLDIWYLLFKDANKLGTRLDYTLEVFDAAVKGDIDLASDFKLEEYISKINHVRRLESLRRAKKVVPIAGDDEESGVVSDRQMYFADASDAYGELMDDCELQYAIERLNSLNAYYMVKAKCDVKYVIRQALIGIPDSIELLKRLCREYSEIADLIKIILGSGHLYEDLFPDVK